MKVTVERLPESQVQLDIAADEAEFAQAMDRAYKAVAKGVQVPGFRPGKAPRQLVEQRVGHETIVEEANRVLMDKLYRDALRQENVQPIGDPVADITEFEPLAFRVVVPVYPTIDPGDYASVRVEPIDAAIADTDVEETIERLRRNASEWVDVEETRQPVEGEQVVIDLKVTEDGEQFQEPVEGATFILGESNIFDGLREQLMEMSTGETREFDLTFGDDDETVSPAIRGKSLHYTATLNQIKTIDLVELDDEFAKKVGNAESVAELREQIASDLHREKTASARTSVVNEALNKVADQAAIELPPVMVDESLEDEVKQLRMRLSQNRETLENYLRANNQSLAELREEIRPDAARRLRNTLVVQEIARRENIVVTDQDVLAEIEKVAAGSENSEAIRGLYQQDQFRGMLRGDLFERNLTDRLIDIVTEGRGAVLNGWVAPEPVVAESTGTGEADADGVIEAEFSDASAPSETTTATAPDEHPAEAELAAAAAVAGDTPDGDNPEAVTVEAKVIAEN
ncbi:MAG: Cell division trigger factor [uncultured Thermomicrobiales bacterium]|uniref:Trigger factor n=1 Tax=uncultured Thermomicrobiales bacterium TaxID=1645740 RepID=A0A6J4V458_9BACT|nr:MAG: Cell division trigger factor [uncultured Thermomicrobiales bacterium]